MTFKLDLKYFCQIDKFYVGRSISHCAFSCSNSRNIQCRTTGHNTHHVHTCTFSIFKIILQKIRHTVSHYANFTRYVCQSRLKPFKLLLCEFCPFNTTIHFAYNCTYFHCGAIYFKITPAAQWHQSTQHYTRKRAFLVSLSVLHLKFHPWGVKLEFLRDIHLLSLFCAELVWGSLTWTQNLW